MPGQVFFAEQIRAVHPNGAPPTPGDYGVVQPQMAKAVAEFGGTLRIRGVTTFNGVPGPAHVFLCDRRNLRVVKAKRSNADGTYEFDKLASLDRYIAIALDDNQSENAVAADRITPGSD